ncbi:MAG: tetratricopeptide repeat protein [Rubrimonas sp.]
MSRFALAALLALLTAAPGPAVANAFLALCGDPSAPAAQVAGACRRALEAGGLTRSQEAAAALNLGAAFLELGQPQQAEEAYDRALAVDPRAALALGGRARAREELGKAPLAAVDWNRAVDLAPRDAELRTGRGAFRLRAGNAQGALEDFDLALRASPRDRDATFNRGLALAALGRDAEAEQAFSAVLRADQGDVGAWLNRARIRASRDRAAALADFDQAVARAPEWSTPWFERGVLLEAMGRSDEAARDFRRAFELGHSSAYLTEKMLELGQPNR